MTLSNWLRDYLYVPLGGSRGGPQRRDRNLLLTMLLGGLWHGAAWTFVIWGALQGVGLVVERRLSENRSGTRATRRRRQIALVPAGREDSRPASHSDSPPYPASPARHDELDDPAPLGPPRRSERRSRWLGRLITFHFICLGWVFFRSDSLSEALHMLWRMVFAWGSAPLVTPLVLAVIGICLAVQLIPRTLTRNVLADLSRLPVLVQAAGFGAFLVLIDLLGPTGVAPFIYFRF